MRDFEIERRIKNKKKRKRRKNIMKKTKKHHKNKKNEQLKRDSRKFNAYHILKLTKKFQKLGLVKILFDVSDMKCKIMLYLSPQIIEETLFSMNNVSNMNFLGSQFEKCEFHYEDDFIILSVSEAFNILKYRMLVKCASLRSKKRLGKEKTFEDMNVFEKKIVSLSAKKYKKLVSLKKLKEARIVNKNRKGGIRYNRYQSENSNEHI